MGNLTDHFSGGGGSNILEQLSFNCDNQTISTLQGDITAPNCTVYQDVTSTSLADVTNSSFAYQPPNGTTKVVVEYRFNQAYDESGYYHTLGSMIGNVDGTDIETSKIQWFDYGYNTYGRFSQIRDIRCEIKINGQADDVANGTMNTWDSPKNIKIRAACYHASTYNYWLHRTNYWVNTGNEEFVIPSYTITAYA